MMVDLNLRLPHLRAKLNWFNDELGSFIVQFSDDSASEMNQLTMSLGTVTLWDFGSLVISRRKQYLLEAVSVTSWQIMAELWEQHCEEMKTMQGSYFTINGKRCCFEFLPSADQASQTWAANEVNQAATYPSPYGNVSTTTLSQVNGILGFDDSCTWQLWSSEEREQKRRPNQHKVSSLRSSNMTNCFSILGRMV